MREADSSAEDRALDVARVEQLIGGLNSAPKSTRWKLRNRLGDRVPWYTLPQEAKPAVDLRTLQEA